MEVEVYTNLNMADLERVLKADGDMFLQYTSVPSEAYCKLLNNLLINRKGVAIRFYNYEGGFKELSFLKDIPNIKKLILNDQHINDINALSFLKDLESFTLSKINYKKLDLRVLFKLEKLSSLELTGLKDVLPLLQEIYNFKEIYLTSIILGDLEFLKNQKYLKNLDLSKCKCTNYEAIGECNNLEYLCLENEKVENVDFISNLENLEFLSLDALDIEELPSFEKCNKLKRVYLSKLPKLKSYEQLATAPNLEEFSITNVPTLNLDEFGFIKKNKSIKKVSVDMKDRKTSGAFYAYLETALYKRW